MSSDVAKAVAAASPASSGLTIMPPESRDGSRQILARWGAFAHGSRGSPAPGVGWDGLVPRRDLQPSLWALGIQ
ncbi:hypothetical protein GCM10028802_20290 [Terrabacter terrigena]